MAVKLNSKGSGHCADLIKEGHLVDASSWSGPSASEENSYIEKHGMQSYGLWFLGVDDSEDPQNKGKFSFPFSSNFRDVNYAGLRAALHRAAQFSHKDIADRAEALFNSAKTKLGKDKDSKGSVEQVAKGKFLIKSF